MAAKAKQQRLPGTEGKIADLQDAAEKYAGIRDERQELTKQEVDLKGKLLGLMKRHKLTEYKYGGVEINVIVEEETVKVRIAKQKEGDEQEDA